MSGGKQYGLILPKSKSGSGQTVQRGVAKAFADDSSGSSGEEMCTDWMKKKLESKLKKPDKKPVSAVEASAAAAEHAAGFSAGLKRGAQIKIAAAIQQDPTVFQYDEVFEEIEKSRAIDKIAKTIEKKDRKPKYIQNLLKQAQVRERENERRVERKVQKEREAEGEEFKDKEAFVTSAYRKKMEEMDKLDAEEAKKDQIENVLDVRKQRDMSGFYRHLYRQTMGEEKDQIESRNEDKEKTEVEEEVEEDVKFERKTIRNKGIRQRHDSKSSSSSSSSSSSGNDSDNEEDVDDEEKPVLTDQDKAEQDKVRRDEMKKQKERREKRKRKIDAGEDSSDSESEAEKSEKDEIEEEVTKKKAKIEKKPKIDIWRKVTVGQVFEDTLQRYLIRKSSRSTQWPIM